MIRIFGKLHFDTSQKKLQIRAQIRKTCAPRQSSNSKNKRIKNSKWDLTWTFEARRNSNSINHEIVQAVLIFKILFGKKNHLGYFYKSRIWQNFFCLSKSWQSKSILGFLVNGSKHERMEFTLNSDNFEFSKSWNIFRSSINFQGSHFNFFNNFLVSPIMNGKYLEYWYSILHNNLRPP